MLLKGEHMESIDPSVIDREAFEDSDSETVKTTMPPPDVVVFNEMRSCADLFRMWQKGTLDIKPDFQRDIVWQKKEMSLFVDSLMKQLPIPSICISWDASTGSRMVIDGLQRIWTIISFLNYETKDWRISKVDGVDERIAGMAISDIFKYQPFLAQTLEEATLPINVIRCDYKNTNHMEYLFQIFSRLNSGGRRLLYQEIRNCIYQGPFNTFLKEYVRENLWLQFVEQTPDEIAKYRFGHEERALRFLAFNDEWENYNSSLVQFLNQYMSEHRDMFPEDLASFRHILDRTLQQFLRVNEKKEPRKNWNAIESALVGIAKNIDFVEGLSDEEVTNRYADLLSTEYFGDRMKEGVMHGTKVRDRIKLAIQYFGPAYGV